MGGGTLVKGDVVVTGVAAASQQNLTPAAAAVGAMQISLTTGASTAVNVFAEGYAVVGTTPGGGESPYKIASHLLMTSGAGDLVNLWPGHGIRVALTTTSRIDLMANPYNAVIQSPATTVASACVGVCVSLLTTSLSGWVQTRGTASTLRSGTSIAGDLIGTGLGTGGAAGPIAAIATQPIVGIAMYATTSTWQITYLTLDG